MTATEHLRAMLDDRGVEWWQSANTLGCIFTRWHSPLFGDEVCAMENGKEGLVLFDHFLTPEQAIAATLGRGTCRIEYHFGEWYCTGCGEMVGTCDTASELCIDGNYVSMWSYCPNCGAKVVDE